MNAHPHPRSSRVIIGFAPGEISSLVNRSVVEEHATEAAFLWRLREKAVRAPQYRLRHLAKLDMRLLAHLRGLQVAGRHGWRAAQTLLGDVSPGAMFVATFVAYSRSDGEEMHKLLLLALAEPALEPALRAGLAWLDEAVLTPVLIRLTRAAQASHRRIALAVASARRNMVAVQIAQAAGDADPALRARAMRSVGEMGDRSGLTLVRAGLRDADPACRFWAAWSMALLGDPAGAPALIDVIMTDIDRRAAALETAVRCSEQGCARDVIRELAASRDGLRDAIRAAGALGDPAVVPWLLDHLDDALHARAAGEAFSTLTGADLEYLDLDRDPPPNAETSEPEEDSLRWPDPAATRAWWMQQRERFVAGRRYLCGELISADATRTVLRDGFQRQRAAASIELVRAAGASPMFPVHERADWQRRRLAA
ncbi:TIGR02270 family protein [Caballeronia sp. M1242]|uniref:TIGR02270 family protein n=1 Tax=Caballeronia sp. M1242 TaxID=2814653 RepID=UPI0019D26D8C|nr:TIGR02270 family protein [Caballeronia sp. M1242]QSN64237.1 TIGR02270 family protein [Caballeronia sp. M1242]